MSAPRVQILTTSHLCRNPRVLKEASTLGAAGFDVTVVTVSTTERFEEMDRALLAALPFRRITLDQRRSVARWRSVGTRGATWLARLALRRTGIESATALGPAGPLLARARSLPADLTIAHNEIPLWAVQALAADGRRVGVDFEDWYSEDLLPCDRRARPLRLLRQAERFALRHAAYTTATSGAMARALADTYDGPTPTVIRNVFPLQPDPLASRAAEITRPGFIWFSQTIGTGRGLEFFLAAWNRMRTPSRFSLLGDIDPAYRDQLLSLVSPERRADISFLPLISPDALPGKLAGFDVGLALEPLEPPNKNLTASNKIFQYLNAGLAVVATDTAGQREIMRAAPECGVLVPGGDPAQLAALLDGLVGEHDRLRACQHAARAAAVAEFCWEKEAPRLLAVVRRALGP